MSKLIFTEIAWDEYQYWQEQDKKTLKKINQLIQYIERNPFEGIGNLNRSRATFQVTGAAELMTTIALSILLMEIIA